MVKQTTTIYFNIDQGYEIFPHETFRKFLRRSPAPLNKIKYLNSDYCGVNLDQTFSEFHKQWPHDLHFFTHCEVCNEYLTDHAVSCPVCQRNVHEECYDQHYQEEECPNCKVNVLGCYFSGSTCDECEEAFCECCRQNGHKYCEGCEPDFDEEEEVEPAKEVEELRNKVLQLEKKIKKQRRTIAFLKKNNKSNVLRTKINK
jgi:hypothetical protein